MDEKKHVGRPTNEEVANRKKKKVVKYSLITVVSILLVGGITLFLNRDKLDFSSMMGASIFKTYKYVVNYDEFFKGEDGYFLKLNDSKIAKLNSCSVSKSKYASCKIFKNIAGEEGILVKAKKSGTVTIKVKFTNKKNKVSTKTIRVKIGADFKGPSCKIRANNVKRGNIVEAVVSCDEKIYYTTTNKDNSKIATIYNSVVQKGCYDTNHYFSDYIWSFEKSGDYSAVIKFKIPKDACLSNDFEIYVAPGALKDSFGNINVNPLKTSIKISK